MVDQLKQLTLKTKVTFYVCSPSDSKKMHTIHEGKSFDGDLPEWMAKFVASADPMLPFEQNDQKKIYLKWTLTSWNILFFLDAAKLSGLTLLLNNLLARTSIMPKPEEASSAEIKVLTEKLQQMKLSYDKELKGHEAAKAELKDLQQQIESLNASNLEHAARLKDALSKNMEMERQLKQQNTTQDIQDLGVNHARSVLTQLKDENARLLAQLRGWEEKYKKLEEQYNALRAKMGQEPVSGAELHQAEPARGLVPIINALNRVIATGDASGLNLDALNLIISTPPKAELERNPDAVKNIIAKLLGMERSGQLTSFQMKKLNSVMKP